MIVSLTLLMARKGELIELGVIEMETYKATWEDEENSRLVQFSVDHTTENGSVEIHSITPTKVSFVCNDTNTVKRSVGVHTDKGRSLLNKSFHAAGMLTELKSEIAVRNESTAAV